MAVVYWIHAPHHTDMTTQGYIGVTTKPDDRFRQHRSAALRGSDLVVHRAIRKYGSSIKYQILVEASEDYCYELEGKLRPLPGIGYNAAIGGEVSPTTGRTHSPETVLKQREAKLGANNPNFGKAISKEQGQKISAANSGEGHFSHGLKSYQLSRSNKAVWSDAEYLHGLYVSVGGCGMRRLSKLSQKYKPDSLETIAKAFNAGWIPSEDADWLLFSADYRTQGN